MNGNLGTGVAVMGAFSLIRFRSVPGTAREICSIFLSMAVGLATGTGYLAAAVLFTLILELAATALHPFFGSGEAETGGTGAEDHHSGESGLHRRYLTICWTAIRLPLGAGAGPHREDGQPVQAALPHCAARIRRKKRRSSTTCAAATAIWKFPAAAP